MARRAHLIFWLLALAAGCGGGGTGSVEHAEVSGKVRFKGQPLPGGRITFVTVQGGFAHVGTIDEHGNYKIAAPVGAVRIAVDNRVLQKQKQKGAKDHVLSKRPGAAAPEPLKGDYVAIPPKYYSAESSGLKYTVLPGPQTFEIRLD
jgi:hypothetical protein